MGRHRQLGTMTLINRIDSRALPDSDIVTASFPHRLNVVLHRLLRSGDPLIEKVKTIISLDRPNSDIE